MTALTVPLAARHVSNPAMTAMTESPAATVRIATSMDRFEIVALQCLSLRALGRGFYSELEIESYLRYTPTLEEYLLEDSTYYVAHVGDRLAGCGGWSIKAPAYSAITHDPAERNLCHVPKVRAMYVHPDFARRGIGRELLAAASVARFEGIFAGVYASPSINLFWFFAFIAITAAVVIGGVQKGIERCCRALVSLLLFVMALMLVDAVRGPGFERAMQFVFGLQGSVTSGGVLETLGHSFFTLSLGMGAMITYGSYLSRKDDAVAAASMVAGFDTVISLLACMTIFPIIFAFGLEANAGPGLVFVSLPVAFAQMSAGQWWATMFFVLLEIAALSSTISLFEVLVSHLVDERGMTRPRACLLSAGALAIAGAPAALSGGTRVFGSALQSVTSGLFRGEGKNWFDLIDYVSSNWLLPLSGLGIALFVSWRVGAQAREQAFRSGTRFGNLYWSWIWLLRYLVPPAVVAVFLHATGLIAGLCGHRISLSYPIPEGQLSMHLAREAISDTEGRDQGGGRHRRSA